MKAGFETFIITIGNGIETGTPLLALPVLVQDIWNTPEERLNVICVFQNL